MKRKLYAELCYVFGIIILALGAAFMEKAGFGMSMIVSPAYILHVKISQYLPFFSFGMAEYTFQALLLIVMIVVLRRFKISFLFSFVTAVIYGFILDMWIWVLSFAPDYGLYTRIPYYIVGLLSCAVGVAFVFHTYIAPEVYELMVMQIADKFKKKTSIVKTVYDLTCLVLSLILSFSFFGMFKFVGVGFGTIICACINGFIIGRISKWMESKFEFPAAFPKFKKIFDK